MASMLFRSSEEWLASAVRGRPACVCLESKSVSMVRRGLLSCIVALHWLQIPVLADEMTASSQLHCLMCPQPQSFCQCDLQLSWTNMIISSLLQARPKRCWRPRQLPGSFQPPPPAHLPPNRCQPTHQRSPSSSSRTCMLLMMPRTREPWILGEPWTAASGAGG